MLNAMRRLALVACVPFFRPLFLARSLEAPLAARAAKKKVGE